MRRSKARALGLEREAVADLQVQRVEQAAPDDRLAGARDHAPVAHRVGPARVVAAERPRPHVDRAAGHGGRGPCDRRGARDALPTGAASSARVRAGETSFGVDEQLVGLGAQRGVLDDAAVGRLCAERHDRRVPIVSARLAIVMAARERLANVSLTPSTTAGGRRSATAACAAREGFVLTLVRPRAIASSTPSRPARHAGSAVKRQTTATTPSDARRHRDRRAARWAWRCPAGWPSARAGAG